jgi:hypothetical protein
MANTLNRERLGLVGRWLPMALLIAQFGAEVHLYSHPLSDSSEKLGTARTCGTCLASSQLQNAVGVAAPAAPVHSMAWVAVIPAALAAATRSSPFRAFRSRAPPPFV